FSSSLTYLSQLDSGSSPDMNLSRISSTYFSISEPNPRNSSFSSFVCTGDIHGSSGMYSSSLSAASNDSGELSAPLKYSSVVIDGKPPPGNVKYLANSSSKDKPSSLFKM